MKIQKKKELIEKVKEDDTKGVIDQIIEYLEDDFSEKYISEELKNQTYTLIVGLSSRYNRLRNENIAGVIDIDNYRIEKNKINRDLKQIIDSFPDVSDQDLFCNSLEDIDLKRVAKNALEYYEKYRNREYDFFLSYSKNDLLEVDRIYNSLTEIGFKVFKSEFVEKSTKYSGTEEEMLENVLRESQVFILYGSPDAFRSKRVEMECEYFFRTYYQINPDFRNFFVYQSDDFMSELVPKDLRNVKFTDSLIVILTDFLRFIDNFKNSGKNIPKYDFHSKKEKLYISLKENNKDSNIIKCPNCSFPIVKPNPSDRFMLFSFLISFGITIWLGSSIFWWLPLIVLSVVCGIIGMILILLIGGIIEFFLNKTFANTEVACKTCNYILKPRDRQQLYEDESVRK